MNEPVESQRIDKWLWNARIAKTRSLAQKLVSGGKVRVNREKITTSSRKIVAGNVLTITLPRDVKILEILGFSEKRGPYSSACLLYKDLSPPKPAPADKTHASQLPAGLVPGSRPTKQQRKQALHLKRNPNNS